MVMVKRVMGTASVTALVSEKRAQLIIGTTYFFALSFFLFEGAAVLFTAGEKTFDLVPGISLVSLPSSAIIFSIFGFALWLKWKHLAPFFLAATWAFWELTFDGWNYLSQPFMWRMDAFWLVLIASAILIAKPKFNFNNYSSVLLFCFVLFSHAYQNDLINFIWSPISQCFSFLFTWKSVEAKYSVLSS